MSDCLYNSAVSRMLKAKFHYAIQLANQRAALRPASNLLANWTA